MKIVVGLIKERAQLIPELWQLGKYFFEAPCSYSEKALKKVWKEDTKLLLTELVKFLNTADDKSPKTLKDSTSKWIENKKIGFGKVIMPLRLALVGALEGVDVFDIVFYVGKEESIRRINSFIEHR